MSEERESDRTGFGTPFELGYQPSLDGLRAFSVAAVMAYHLGLSWMGGGFLGVDAFFVLSGFLITTLLLREYRTNGRISFRDFYVRRALRLLPALMMLLVAVAVYVLWFGPSGADSGTYREAVATILYVSNWQQAYTLSFPFYLAHTWSLSIEEQFYVVWPVVLAIFLALGIRGRQLLWLIALGACVLAILAMSRTGFGDHDLARAYFGTDTRAPALLIGCALAVALSLGWVPRTTAAQDLIRTVAWGSAGFIVVGWVIIEGTGDERLFAGGLAAEGPAVGVVLLHVLVAPQGLMARWLAKRPLAFVGRISYGLYLWHWPVYLIVEGWNWPFWPGVAVKIVIAATLAVASFLVVEQPILSLRGRFQALGAPEISS